MKKNNQIKQYSKTSDAFVSFSVGKKFPYDLSHYPIDANIMEMLGHPFFIISMGNIQSEELAHFEQGEPIEFRVYSGTGTYKNYNLLLCKFKNSIQEFAFNPNLCRDDIIDYMNAESNAFSIAILEGTTREIKILRSLGFADETRDELYKIWHNMLSDNVPQEKFIRWYHNLFNLSTAQLWELARPVGNWITSF